MKVKCLFNESIISFRITSSGPRNSGNVCIEIHDYPKNCFVYLSPSQTKELIPQLQSFVDTGDWIKPKKKYVVISKTREWIRLIPESELYEYDGTGAEIYELTEDRKVK